MSSRVTPPGPVVLGSTVDLVCEASAGDLPISFIWIGPNGIAVNPNDTDGTVSITLSGGDYGMYTCTATNEFGIDTAAVTVEERGIIIIQICNLKISLVLHKRYILDYNYDGQDYALHT